MGLCDAVCDGHIQTVGNAVESDEAMVKILQAFCNFWSTTLKVSFNHHQSVEVPLLANDMKVDIGSTAVASRMASVVVPCSNTHEGQHLVFN